MMKKSIAALAILTLFSTTVAALDNPGSPERTVTMRVECSKNIGSGQLKVSSNVYWTYDDVNGGWKANLFDLMPKVEGNVGSISRAVVFEATTWVDGNRTRKTGFQRMEKTVDQWKFGAWNNVLMTTFRLPASNTPLLEAYVELDGCIGSSAIYAPN